MKFLAKVGLLCLITIANCYAETSDVTTQDIKKALGFSLKQLEEEKQDLELLLKGDSQEIVNEQGSDLNNLSSYSVVLPHTTQPSISKFEKAVLIRYLNDTTDIRYAKLLSIIHLKESILNNKIGGMAFKHTLLAHYFINKVLALDEYNVWAKKYKDKTATEIEKIVSSESPIATSEDHIAHAYFIDTFNYHEENRYIALDMLLDDFVLDPMNVYTSFTLNALNLWIGGEGNYDDPTIIYNFILGSYFSERAMNQARLLEEKWLANPSTTTRFRLSSILGGFSVLHRRWLADLHNDVLAIGMIDNENRAWRLIQPAFHAFTVGVVFFEDKINFAEGMFAWWDADAFCKNVPVRTCMNRPRFSHNYATFVLGYVDFLLKNGDTETAKRFLSLRNIPNFTPMQSFGKWTLGKDAWIHREKYLYEISELYQNNNVDDDPVHLLLNKHKWGTTTSTCQLCHQAQDMVWSEDEQNNIILPPEEVATVGAWPHISTSWYGEYR